MLAATINQSTVLALASGENSKLASLVFWAALGGFIVLVGVVMEVVWEKHWYDNISDFHRSEKIRYWGARILILGILWEVVSAGVFAIKEESAKRTTDTQIARIDPIKRPVEQVSAHVELRLAGDAPLVRRIPITPTNSTPISEAVLFFRSVKAERAAGTRHRVTLALTASKYTKQGDDVGIDFEWAPLAHIVGSDISNATAEELLNEMDAFELLLRFLPKRTEVIGGNVTLFLNSVPKSFPIPSQKMGLSDMVSCFMADGTNPPVVIDPK